MAALLLSRSVGSAAWPRVKGKLEARKLVRPREWQPPGVPRGPTVCAAAAGPEAGPRLRGDRPAPAAPRSRPSRPASPIFAPAPNSGPIRESQICSPNQALEHAPLRLACLLPHAHSLQSQRASGLARVSAGLRRTPGRGRRPRSAGSEEMARSPSVAFVYLRAANGKVVEKREKPVLAIMREDPP